jgi:protoheme IX farnesyltransferase
MSDTSDENVMQSGFIPIGFWKNFAGLVKGKQTFLLLFTALFAYLITAHQYDQYDFVDVMLLMTGLFFAVSGSTLLNMYIDRDIDAQMERTKDRAIPSGRISPRSVLWHGLVFAALGVSIAGLVNRITMALILGGLFFDVVVYTLWLKRRTKWSIIFGGISGGLPAMAGRTAVTNQIDIEGGLFLLLILIWIPLHILSLATLPKNLLGYEEAGVPMWPVESGVAETRTVITIAAFLDGLVIVTTGIVLKIHIIAQIPLFGMGLVMIYLAVKNFMKPTHDGTFKLFKFASMFLGIVFLWLYIAIVMTPRLFELVPY